MLFVYCLYIVYITDIRYIVIAACRENEFKCYVTGVCIPLLLAGNGVYDCGHPLDHSDEIEEIGE